MARLDDYIKKLERIDELRKKESLSQKEISELQRLLNQRLSDTETIYDRIDDSLGGISAQSISWSRTMNGVYSTLMDVDGSIRKTNLALGFSGKRSRVLRDNFKEVAGYAARLGGSASDLREITTGFAEQTGRARALTDETLKNILDMGHGTALGVRGATELVSNYHLIGVDAERAAQHTLGMVEASERMGVSAAKVLETINKNFSRLRMFTFIQGVKGFSDMSAYAEKMRIDVSQALDSAEAARKLENAIEMAAQLQVMGGEFAKTDPLELLFLARNDPDAYAKKINNLTKGVVSFRRMSDGTFEHFISPADIDRLRRSADVLGLQSNELMEQARRMAEIQKIREQTRGLGLSEKEQEIIESLTKFDSDLGRFTIDIGGEIHNLERLSSQQLKMFAQQGKTLEQRAIAAQTFDEAFRATIEELKTVLLPLLSGINKILSDIRPIAIKINEWVSNLSDANKNLIIGMGKALLVIKGLTIVFKLGRALWIKTMMFYTGMGALLKGLGTLKTVGGGVMGKHGKPINAPALKAFQMGQINREKELLRIQRERANLGGARAGRAGMGVMRGGVGVGAAAVGIGGGVAIAAMGIAQLAEAMKDLSPENAKLLRDIGTTLAITFPLAAIGVALTGKSLAAASPALLKFGVSLLAVGAGVALIGGGIALAGKGIQFVFEGVGGFLEKLSKLEPAQIFKLSGSLYALIPAVISLGTAGLYVGPGLSMLSLSLLAVGKASGVFERNITNMANLGDDARESIGKIAKGVHEMGGALDNFGLRNLGGLIALRGMLRTIAKNADDLEKIGGAFEHITTVMSGRSEDYERIEKMIKSISNLEMKDKSAFGELAKLLKTPLKVEFADRDVQFKANVTLKLDKKTIANEIAIFLPNAIERSRTNK